MMFAPLAKLFGLNNGSPRKPKRNSTTTNSNEQLQIVPSDDVGYQLTKASRASSNNSVHQNYEIGREIGRGSFSTVREGVCRVTSATVAVKRLDKVTTSNIQLTNEVEALRRVQGHPNVIRLITAIEEGDHVFITTPLCPNSSLFDYVCNNGPLSEAEACSWAHQLFDAIRHCHEKGIVNRDLKPENILLDELMRLVIADFGLSANVGDVTLRNLSTATGSPVFAAPEVYSALKTPYAGGPADMYSAGAIIHCMLTAELPFDIDNFKEEWAHYTPPENLSPACQRLLARLLSTDPSARPTADEALESDWLRGGPFSSSPNLAAFKSS